MVIHNKKWNFDWTTGRSECLLFLLFIFDNTDQNIWLLFFKRYSAGLTTLRRLGDLSAGWIPISQARRLTPRLNGLIQPAEHSAALWTQPLPPPWYLYTSLAVIIYSNSHPLVTTCKLALYHCQIGRFERSDFCLFPRSNITNGLSIKFLLKDKRIFFRKIDNELA